MCVFDVVIETDEGYRIIQVAILPSDVISVNKTDDGQVFLQTKLSEKIVKLNMTFENAVAVINALL